MGGKDKAMNGYCISGQEPVYPSGPVIVSGIRTSSTETDAERIARLSQEVGRLRAERDDLAARIDHRTFGVNEVEGLRTTTIHGDEGELCVAYAQSPGYGPELVEVWVGCEWWSVDQLAPSFAERLQRSLEAKRGW
jgi:hypothetical protein